MQTCCVKHLHLVQSEDAFSNWITSLIVKPQLIYSIQFLGLTTYHAIAQYVFRAKRATNQPCGKNKA